MDGNVGLSTTLRMDCWEILYKPSWSRVDESQWLWWSPDFFFSNTTKRLTCLFCFLSIQLFDWLPWKLKHILMVPQRLILMILVIHRVFLVKPPAGPRFHLFSSSTWWVGTKCCTNIHGSRVMDPNDLGDPLTFHLEPSSGQNFNLTKNLQN